MPYRESVKSLIALVAGAGMMIVSAVTSHPAPAPAPQHIGMINVAGFVAGAILLLAGLMFDGMLPAKPQKTGNTDD